MVYVYFGCVPTKGRYRIDFLISPPKQMLWVHEIAVALRWLFRICSHMLSIVGNEIVTVYSQKLAW